MPAEICLALRLQFFGREAKAHLDMQITTATADALQHYLDLANQQMKLTAENMANVDTPGYKLMAVALNLGEESTVS